MKGRGNFLTSIVKDEIATDSCPSEIKTYLSKWTHLVFVPYRFQKSLFLLINKAKGLRTNQPLSLVLFQEHSVT